MSISYLETRGVQFSPRSRCLRVVLARLVDLQVPRVRVVHRSLGGRVLLGVLQVLVSPVSLCFRVTLEPRALLVFHPSHWVLVVLQRKRRRDVRCRCDTHRGG